MKFKLSTFLLFLLCVSFIVPAFARPDVKLSELDPIGGGFNQTQKTESVSDKIVSHEIWRYQYDDGGWAVYNLNRRYTRLTGFFGMFDRDREDSEKKGKRYSFVVKADGREIARGSVGTDGSREEIDLDLTDVKSLRIEMDKFLVFAEPTLQPLGVSKANLLIPVNGGVAKGKTKLVWTPVDGAVSYSVLIYCSTSDKPLAPDQQRFWAFTTSDGQSEYTVDFSAMPTGQYKWQVMAFAAKRPLGDVSLLRSFLVSH